MRMSAASSLRMQSVSVEEATEVKVACLGLEGFQMVYFTLHWHLPAIRCDHETAVVELPLSRPVQHLPSLQHVHESPVRFARTVGQPVWGVCL